ncbi:MAG: DnaJ domain-containing protein [Candidatus Margulisiibacteriota bacterium]
MSKISFEEIDRARKTLELEDKVTLEEIKRAHRRLSKKWHPDKCKKKDKELCHEKMKEINKAYKIVLKYIEDYRFSFAKEKVIEESPEERWKAQFGSDPLWGTGKG